MILMEFSNKFSVMSSIIQVVLVGDSRGVTLAPYNVLYSGQAEMLQRCNMPFDKKFGDVWVIIFLFSKN